MKKLAAVFLVFLLLNQASFAENKKPLQLIISSPDNQIFDLKNNFGKKTTIVIFWATWCSNCKEVMMMLDEISKEKNPQIEIVGISIDKENQREVFSEMSKKFSYKNFMLADAKINDFGEPRFTPQVRIIDQNGNQMIAKNTLDKKDLILAIQN